MAMAFAAAERVAAAARVAVETAAATARAVELAEAVKAAARAVGALQVGEMAVMVELEPTQQLLVWLCSRDNCSAIF